jgi:hypothetical protein
MNIFYLHNDPVKCAEMHNDKHCIKMILEYCQLLSTAHRILDGTETQAKSKTGRNVKRWVLNNEMENIYYSATHISHPSAVWARQSGANYDWLVHLLMALCKEYTYRYGKVHKCEQIGLVQALRIHPKNIPNDRVFTEPTPAMPEDVKISGDSIASYRNYYINNKTHLASWKGKVNSRPIPKWYTEGCLQKMVDINQELGLYA